MGRYYFDVRRGQISIVDDIGRECCNLSEAHVHGVALAERLVRKHSMLRQRGWVIDVIGPGSAPALSIMLAGTRLTLRERETTRQAMPPEAKSQLSADGANRSHRRN